MHPAFQALKRNKPLQSRSLAWEAVIGPQRDMACTALKRSGLNEARGCICVLALSGFKKDKRLIFRLPNRDFIAVQSRASVVGTPFQILVSSLIHKYAFGSLRAGFRQQGINVMQAVIFDMDGTLIDSEPMWKEAEEDVFASVGVTVSEELSATTAFMTTRAVTEFWYSHFPWSGKTLEQVENEVIDRVATLICEKGSPMEGVYEVLRFFQNKKFKIGLSTTAPSRLIPVVLNKLGISGFFHSTSSSEYETHGKPDPAVYLTTAQKLAVEPSRCIAFEDSRSGIISASKAKMKVVAVPPRSEFSARKYELAHITLGRLSEFNDSHLEKIAHDL